MYEVDYYIHGAQSQRNSIKELLLTTTLSMGGNTDDESDLNIPLGLVMKVLADDEMHSGMMMHNLHLPLIFLHIQGLEHVLHL